MIDFIRDNLVACIVVGISFAVLILIITVVVVKEVKKRHQANLDKMLTDIPIISEAEVAVTETPQGVRGGDADLKWVREQSFGKENIAEDDLQSSQTGDNQMKKTKEDEKKVVAKAKTTKTASKPEPKTTAKTPTKKVEAKKTTAGKTTAKKVVGKWVVREKGEGEFVAFLHANNGEIILTSEIYSTADGAKKGIATIQKNVGEDNFIVYCDKNRNYYFKLKNANNRFLCVGETYPTKSSCQSAIESVKRFVDATVVDEVEKDITLIKYVLPADDGKEKKSGYAGKWLINEVEDMFIAQLYASNGELLLSSEAYTTPSSAKSAIETITTNGVNGNFIIDVDKKGRYFFKLRNAQKSTLCVGETYSQLAKCQSAIDSVRRFLKTAKLAD